MGISLGRRAALGFGAMAALAGRPLAIRTAKAQTIARTARVIVGFPAGGSSDVMARLYAEKVHGLYAPQVIVENRAGVAGRIAVEAAKGAEPDGTTWLQTPASMLTLQPHVFPQEVRYGALTDFAPVSMVCTFPFALAVPAGHPARSLEECATWARSLSGEVPFASPAAGSAPHFMGIMVAKALGLRLTHVPYRGAAPAVQDLVEGRLPAFVGVLGDISPQQGTGRGDVRGARSAGAAGIRRRHLRRPSRPPRAHPAEARGMGLDRPRERLPAGELSRDRFAQLTLP